MKKTLEKVFFVSKKRLLVIGVKMALPSLRQLNLYLKTLLIFQELMGNWFLI